ncbi:Putative conjugal transfer protein [Ralstonia thomasii]|uniref:P-type conjugative transfer ATPase TrbB n=1 Tax=Ralstonia thomasii TaxID=3058596 RepID=UPI0028F56F41|nr:P-type conjugative transfer ATPase TrbB [Ralstonia sp. LMG 18095]CAJ0718496.1 Putative conjugal transfer protein [Ralstonia sp. LMG 18095]
MTSADLSPDVAEDLSPKLERWRQKIARDAGSLVMDALADEKTVELLLNADGRLWQERLGEPMKPIGTIRPAQAAALVKAVASYHGKEASDLNPLVEGEFPLNGARFAGQLPPVVQAPTFAIRMKAVAIYSLSQYVDAGIMTSQQFEVLQAAASDYKNILVVGGTGSGKTTLVNAIIKQQVDHNPDDRFLIIEDTRELQCAAVNVVQYHTTIDVDMTRLVKTALRMRPTRILVGEVRGKEALDLLDAWNTGHEGGACTIHSKTALAGLVRLESLVTRHESAPKHIPPLIAEAVNVVVHIERTKAGSRVVTEILEVLGYENGQYITKVL